MLMNELVARGSNRKWSSLPLRGSSRRDDADSRSTSTARSILPHAIPLAFVGPWMTPTSPTLCIFQDRLEILSSVFRVQPALAAANVCPILFLSLSSVTRAVAFGVPFLTSPFRFAV